MRYLSYICIIFCLISYIFSTAPPVIGRSASCSPRNAPTTPTRRACPSQGTHIGLFQSTHLRTPVIDHPFQSDSYEWYACDTTGWWIHSSKII